MSKHDDDTCPHLVRASLLEAENARLRAEVDHLRDCLGDAHAHNIKEQVEIEMCIESLKAEVERLCKAGDAMAENLLEGCNHKHNMNALNWYTAKEGKQP